ncbi:MAG: sigma-70 factor domain-containing protein, partial [Acidimicrobiales bacterium]|nr:sigma-70 factor domain-containing protein [Acidimicrobiales bacterium]
MAKTQGRGSEEEDLLQLYLNDIGKYPLLTRDDEVRLGTLTQKGLAAAETLARGDTLTMAAQEELEQDVVAGADAHR